MPGVLNLLLARQHLQELLRAGEQERRGAALRADRPRAAALLHGLLPRRRGDPEARGAADDRGVPS